MKITPKGMRALKGIRDSEFHDGQNPVGNPVWSWSCNPFSGDEEKSFGGVVKTLIKHGLVKSDGGFGDEACLTLTQAGYDALINDTAVSNGVVNKAT